MTTPSLDAAHLHEMARDPDKPPPRAFMDANDDVERTEQAYRAAVAHRHELIREARRLRVPFAAISRWTGINTRTLSEIWKTR